MAIATQDPPKEKRDKEILEEDYKSYDSKADEDNKNNNNPNDVKNDNAQNNEAAHDPENDQVVADIIKDVVDTNNNNNIDVPNNDVKLNDIKDADYPADNQDSNNAEETYRDFEENAKVAEGGFKKAVVPDFKGPTNERQTAVVAAFQHAWTGYKKFAWGHDHLRQELLNFTIRSIFNVKINLCKSKRCHKA